MPRRQGPTKPLTSKPWIAPVDHQGSQEKVDLPSCPRASGRPESWLPAKLKSSRRVQPPIEFGRPEIRFPARERMRNFGSPPMLSGSSSKRFPCSQSPCAVEIPKSNHQVLVLTMLHHIHRQFQILDPSQGATKNSSRSNSGSCRGTATQPSTQLCHILAATSASHPPWKNTGNFSQLCTCLVLSGGGNIYTHYLSCNTCPL